MLASPQGAERAANAAASRQAITDLLSHGKTGITTEQIFAAFPRYVEQDDELITRPRWHETGLRDLCFNELFKLGRTRAARMLLCVVSPRLGVPYSDMER